jgi:hypothetical protein
VPCGERIIVTSSHVNVSDHNLKHMYGSYGRILESNPVIMRATTLQQVIVEVWLYIHFFSFLSDEFASFDREANFLRLKELQLPADEAIFQC